MPKKSNKIKKSARKTHSGAKKRFTLTGTGKIRRRTAGQDHFNSRESGKTTRSKRKDATVTVGPRIRELLGKKR